MYKLYAVVMRCDRGSSRDTARRMHGNACVLLILHRTGNHQPTYLGSVTWSL